ncbi:hypothetical protein [Halobacterium zhouii]|uniref:hypothetical protein n=1 Tax=Halobacterium zhouii TaxID=2902624 RepID=UPI001E3732A6|nr:hypothetical protein [Halobacterium zhouii]
MLEPIFKGPLGWLFKLALLGAVVVVGGYAVGADPIAFGMDLVSQAIDAVLDAIADAVMDRIPDLNPL